MSKKTATLGYLFSVAVLFSSCGNTTSENNASSSAKDPYTIESDVHLIDGYEAITAENLVNVLVEIPTGTLEKWEVEKTSGHLKLEFRDGKPRVVKYLGYPGNYGMIPKTLLPKNMGGDGDPLDVIVLGEAFERGSVVPCKLIGVIELLDKGEQDDKLIAVPANSHFSTLNNISELKENYNGVLEILETWFSNYKGPGKIKIKNVSDSDRAYEILEYAITGYQEHRN